MIIVGADPGLHGGICIFEDGVLQWMVPAASFPVGHEPRYDSLAMWNSLADIHVDLSVIERVYARNRQSIQSMFTFGRVYGNLETILDIKSDKVEYVDPKTWQKHSGLSGNKGYIQTRFEEEVGTDHGFKYKALEGVADAYWIGRYGLEALTGD